VAHGAPLARAGQPVHIAAEGIGALTFPIEAAA
jgi:hypothetical protein